jgi:hypothetical protein
MTTSRVQTVVITDALYNQLSVKASALGFTSVEQFLASPLMLMLFEHPMFDVIAPNALRDLFQYLEELLARRRTLVGRIDEMRQRMFTVYGEMPDSVPLIREARSQPKLLLT